VIADFAGSAPQAVGPVNAIYAVTASAVYNAILHLTDPTIPRNEGCYRPITVIAPPGTIVNCTFPAPVAGGNTETSPRITDMVFGALQHAIPERVVAACGGTSSPFLFGGVDPRDGGLYAHFHFEGVGWGGRNGMDGNDMVVTINGNCRNTPVEVFETRYPAFLIEEYRLLPDSGGPGEFRGGLGGERLLTVTSEVTVSALLNRMKADPWGILDGGSGARGGIWVKRRGESDWQTFVDAFGTMSPSKFSGIRLHPGDQVRLVMPGGGGYGDPRRRDRSLVARDLDEGFITLDAARADYGYTG
jgi:N-methylhydantoinase B